MIWRSVKTLVSMFLFGVLLAGTLSAADRTGSGLAFLRIGVGARASGMGEAFTAVSDDASATYWNPAGLALVEGTEVMFMNNSFIQDISQEFIAVASDLGNLHIGGAFNLVSLGTLERRDERGEFRGEFKPFDFAGSFSVAYSPLDWVDVGGTVKGIVEDIDTETAYGALVDVGVLARLPVDGLSAGFVAQHLGPSIKFISDPFDAPRTYRAGASFVRRLPGFSSRAGIAVDLVFPMDDDTQVNIGGEWTYKDFVSGRIGFRGGSDTQGMTTGLGVYYKQFLIDYAYVPFSEYLGNTHRIGVSYRFR